MEDWPIVLDFPSFPALGNGGAESVDFGSENLAKLGVSPLKFLGGMYEHPYRRQTISEYTALCGKVSRKSAQGRRKIGGRKKEITPPKYNSLRYR